MAYLPLLLLLLHSMPASAHPFDPLTPAEITHAVATARTHYPADHYKLYGCQLLLPHKAQVLEWQTTNTSVPARVANLWLRTPGSTSLWSVDVDVSDPAGALLSEQLVHDVQPPMRGDSGELAAGLQAALDDPRVLQVLQRRGYRPDQVTADYDSVGHYPAAGVFTSPRQAAFEFYVAIGTNMYSRPLGLMARVDLDTNDVISVYDSQLNASNVPPEKGGDLNVPMRKDPPRQFKTTRPDGVSYSVDGNIVSWQRWRFHARTDWRVGVAIGTVQYNDAGRLRSIAHEIYLSEMFVPYQLADRQWYYRTFLDAGEFGMGSDANQLSSAECGGGEAHFFDLHDATINGSVVTLKSIACVFERWTGDPVWLQGEVCQDGHPCTPKQVRAGVELVLRTIPRVGNYDYVCDTIFRLDGSIHFKVGATGVDAMKAVRAQQPDGKMVHAAQMDGFRAAPYHDHIFNFRIDLDVDGARNQLVVGKIEQYVPSNVPRATMWGVNFNNVNSESEGRRDLDDSIRKPEVWLVQNPKSVDETTKNAAAYTLIPAANLATLMNPNGQLQQRAGFTLHHLWTTPYRKDERYAAGDWPNQRAGGLDGLANWTSANRSIENTDIVLWYTVGFHHITLQENLPVLPTFWGAEFDLMPANFFQSNPALDLPQAPNN